MNCFPCFSCEKSDSGEDKEQLPVAQPKEAGAPSLPSQPSDTQNLDHENIAAKAFTFREMATATKNFRQECVIYDDGFGRVFKGTLKSSGQVVAIKQLDRNGMKAAKEFLDEVSTLSPLKHPNLVELLGYCADGDQRILIYEYIPLGSLEAHLLDRSAGKSPLDWLTRMKIATGAAQGLEYLHEKANPPVIYRDFKSSKILLDEEYNPKLCDFGLVKLAQSGNTASSVPPRVMGTYGYSAPEYASTGELTLKSDIYSFGVVLLELITGRRAIDPNRPANEQNLVTWAQPIFRDPKRFPEMADPLMNNEFSVKSLNQAVGVVAMCLQEEPTVRPYITDVVAALSFLDFDAKDPPAPTPSSDKESESEGSYSDQNENDNNDSDDGRSSDDHEDINETRDDKCASSSSDHDDNGTNMNDNIDDDDDKSGSSMDHEDSALTIEHDNRNSSSDNLLDEDSGNEDYDDDEVQRKSRTKSIKSANSKKGKVMELSDDESMYSSGSSRSSSSNDELGEKKTSRQTTKKVKSTSSSVGNSSTRKSKNRWRRAKLAMNNETKTD